MIAEFTKVADLPDDFGDFTLARMGVDWLGRALLTLRGRGARSGSLRVLRSDGGSWARVLNVPCDLAEVRYQPLPNGEQLVVGTRCRRERDGRTESNALVYGADGDLRRRFSVGDGVDDVQVTASGGVWVAYATEGTMGEYGAFGWGRLSPEEWVEPVGGSGLVEFDAAGSVVREYLPTRTVKRVMDCFALNAMDGEVWITYHPDFPLVCLSAVDTVRTWATELGDIDALAVAGELVVTYSMRARVPLRCRAGRLGNPAPDWLEPLRISLAERGEITAVRRVVGRGGDLHAFTDRAWFRLRCAALGVTA